MVKGHDPDLESSDSEDSKHRRNRLGRGAAIFMVLPVSPHAASRPTDVRLGPQMSGWATKDHISARAILITEVTCNVVNQLKGAAIFICNENRGASGWPCSSVAYMSVAPCGRQLAAGALQHAAPLPWAQH